MSSAGSGRSSPSTAPPAEPRRPDNAWLAERLERVSEVLDAQQANPFRVRAWRQAAETLRHLPEPVWRILEQRGQPGLIELPTIGRTIARALESLVHSGRLALLDSVDGETHPPDPFTSVPGIGPELARRIHEELHLETLHELEAAAWDGRLGRVPGFGAGRLRAVRESLAGRFQRHPAAEHAHHAVDEPPVAELLDVDREYRDKAARDKLLRIAPKRFNPEHKAWLPVLHTHRGERHYTALFSNTGRAHELGTTHDWVVIYRDDKGGDGRWTVVTAHGGPLRGRRVVRGRERECAQLAADPPADG